MLNKIDTNDMFCVRRLHEAISPDVCIMCGVNSESVSNVFFHCSVDDFLWNTLFGIFGLVCPVILDQFLLIGFASFGKRKPNLCGSVLAKLFFGVFGRSVILTPLMTDFQTKVCGIRLRV